MGERPDCSDGSVRAPVDAGFLPPRLPSSDLRQGCIRTDQCKDDPSRLSRSVASIEVESPCPQSLAWDRRIGGRLENLFSLLTEWQWTRCLFIAELKAAIS